MYAAAFFVVEVLPRAAAPGPIAAGLTVDLVVLVPALYYAVMIRGRGWPVITLAPVFLLSFGAASLAVPAEYHALLSVIGYALPAVELALVGYVGYKAWRVVRANRSARKAGGDFYDRVRETLRGAFDAPAAAGALAYEASHLPLRLFDPTGQTAGVRVLVSPPERGTGLFSPPCSWPPPMELVGVHFLLRSWSETAALIHIALSLYGIVWLVGDYRAMRRRPHELRANALLVRYGLRWDLEATWNQVSLVRRTRQPAAGDGYLSTVPIGSPRYVVELSEPTEATGPYGITREVRHVGLTVDDAEAFEERLRSLGVRVEL